MSTLNRQGLTVADVMLDLDGCPLAHENTILKEVLEEMDSHRMGVVCVTDAEMRLKGILTEGDIRRRLLRVQKPLAALLADDVSNHTIKTPVTIKPDVRLVDAITLMGERKIWDLPVVGADEKLIGLLHLHQAIQAVLEVNG